MHATQTDARKLTELDFARLQTLMFGDEAARLAEVLNDVDVVPARAIPPGVITMYARFVVRDLRLQRRQLMVICYPSEAEPRNGFISVLSPAGTALIGLSDGAHARWVGSDGEQCEVQIERVLFQPEAAGDYLT